MDTFESRGGLLRDGSPESPGRAGRRVAYDAASPPPMEQAETADSDPEDLPRLAAAARAGDRIALERLFVLYKDRVFRTALLLLSNREAAEAVTEEAFVRYYGNSTAESTPFPKWIYRTVVAICVDHMSEGDAAESERLSVDDPDRHSALRRRIAGALGRLEARSRVAFVLREGQRLSYGEIAEVMDDEPANIAHYLADARAGLAGVLEQIEFEAWNVG